MRATTYLLALLPIFLLGQPAHAGERAEYYFSAGAGLSLLEESDFNTVPVNNVLGAFEFKNTPSFSLAVGRHFWDHFRGEFELTYRNAKFDNTTVNGANLPSTGDIETSGFMLNLYYDILPDSLVNPYVTGGIGTVYHKLHFIEAAGSASNSDNVSAYQVGGGFNVALTEDLLWFTDYRFFATEKPVFGAVEVEYKSHDIRTGINYIF